MKWKASQKAVCLVEMKTGKKRYMQVFGFGILGLVLINIVWSAWPELFKSFGLRTSLVMPADKDQLSMLGQLGDSYGGFNALVGAVTLLGLGVTIALQVHSLNQRDEEKELDRFDKIFSRIMTSLENHVEVMTDVRGKMDDRGLGGSLVRGKETFQIWAETITQEMIDRGVATAAGKEVAPSPNLTLDHLRQAYNDLFKKKHEQLAPYWRLLYHAFKTIDDKKISADEKRLYADIVRADFTPSQSFLLALNGIGHFGDRFKDLINRYHLLKHMPDNFRQTFRSAYKESAFTDED